MNLDHNKAHGPDIIPARLLKETAARSLCSLFNKSLRIGVVPDDWKLANVHVVSACLQTRRKSQGRKLPTNFSAISHLKNPRTLCI
jgi:hypothetical protein